MASPSLETLFTRATQVQIFDFLLLAGRALGLQVDSWIDGDATKTQFFTESEYLSSLESNVRGMIAAGFGTFAAADPGLYDWLALWASETFLYVADEAIAAQTSVTLTNNGGALLTADELAAGRLTFENTTTGSTYTNSTGPDGGAPLLPFPGPGNVVTMTVVSNLPGTDGNAAAGEIALQTGLPEVTATNGTAATGLDRETSESILRGAHAKLGPISPNGASGAKDSVATDKELTGVPTVTRSRTFPDTTTGDVTQYIAGPAGAVSNDDVARVEAAVVVWAVSQCTTLALSSAVNRIIHVTYELWVRNTIGLTAPEIVQLIEDNFAVWFPGRPIGGDTKEGDPVGKVFKSAVEGVIKRAGRDEIADDGTVTRLDIIAPYFIDLDVTTPGADIGLLDQEVPVQGTITATTIHLETPAAL